MRKLFGTVKWFGGYNLAEKKINDYGFVIGEDSNEYYFHKSGLILSPKLTFHDFECNSKDRVVLFTPSVEHGKKLAKDVFCDLEDKALIQEIFDSIVIDKPEEFEKLALVYRSKIRSLLLSYGVECGEDINKHLAYFSVLKKYLSREQNPISYIVNVFKRKKYSLPKIGALLIENNVMNDPEKIIYYWPTEIIYTEPVTEYLKGKTHNIKYLSNDHRKILLHCDCIDIEEFIKDSDDLGYVWENENELFEKYISRFEKESFEGNANCNISRIWWFAYSKNKVDVYKMIQNKIESVFVEKFFRNPLYQMDSNFMLRSTVLDSLSSLLVEDDSKLSMFWSIIEKQNISLQTLGTLGRETQENNGKQFDNDYIWDNSTYSSFLINLKVKLWKKYSQNDQLLKELIEKIEKSSYTYDNREIEIIGYNIFKYLLYKKDRRFIKFYKSYYKNFQCFEAIFLTSLFKIIIDANNIDTAYDLMMDIVWKYISTDREFDNSVFHLFPQCNTMRSRGLSCEAFYWKTTLDANKEKDIYLCRHQACSYPKVLPNLEKDYLFYSVFDWLFYYGINYLNETKPQNIDFPIKLAGYVNRIREIKPRLHCKECDKIMVPNYKYAMKTYNEYNEATQKYEIKTKSAAYRATVFQCVTDTCPQAGKQIYINHCIGCSGIIDSREDENKCNSGYYICNECGACCANHSQHKEFEN